MIKTNNNLQDINFNSLVDLYIEYPTLSIPILGSILSNH